MITPQQLIDEARALQGIPWRHMGRTHRGLDCIGMVVLSMRACGLDLPQLVGLRDRPYGRAADPQLLEKVQQHLTPAPGRIPGSLALFRFYGESCPRHFGIITENGNVIHCNSKYGGVMEHGLRAHWANWLHSVWLLPGIDYEL